MTKSTKTEYARQMPSIRVAARCYSSEIGQTLAFVLDEQFNFVPMSERVHNCLGSIDILSLDDLRFHKQWHGIRSFLLIKNFGKTSMREVEDILRHRLAGTEKQFSHA